MASKSRKGLRSGYTTGACAAAAAKAAALLLLGIELPLKEGKAAVEIPFPDGSRALFPLKDFGRRSAESAAWASVVKDAGDDPDITNGAEIRADVRLLLGSNGDAPSLLIKGGKGVGVVTKAGLPVAVGEAAINPGPRRMIEEAVQEALRASSSRSSGAGSLEITVSVPAGEELAIKTLNPRLGIIGGISILGSTGIVRPISSEAWTATITASMDVAAAMGSREVVLSAGRASETAHMKKYGFPEEAYVMMGDYLEFSLRDARKHGFERIHLCAQWAKMLKIAMATPQTHVRHGAIDMQKTWAFLGARGCTPSPSSSGEMQEFNTAREIFDYLRDAAPDRFDAVLAEVCAAAKRYAEEISGGVPVLAHLVSYEGEIIARSD